MVKPIAGIPPFSGKDAQWLSDYLDKAKPDPKKEELAKSDAAIAKSIKRVDDIHCK